MFEKKENFFKENKIIIAIIIGAIIIGGAIYFSGYKEKDSKNIQTYNNENQQNTSAPREENSVDIPLVENEDSEIKITGTIDYTEADNFVGEYKTVRGKVVQIYYSAKSDTTFLNFCSNYQGCPFSSVVFSSDKSKFGDLNQYEGKTVEITGLIKTYKGSAEIILNNPSQIKIVD